MCKNRNIPENDNSGLNENQILSRVELNTNLDCDNQERGKKRSLSLKNFFDSHAFN